MFGFIGQPQSEGSKCSCLLNEWWQQQQRLWPGLFLVETQWPDWTWGICCTSSLNPDTNQRPWDQFLGHRPNVHMNTLRGDINSCFFHLFFTHSTDCSYLRLELLSPPLSFYLPLTNMHTYTLEHTLPGAMWECLFIRQRPAAHLVTAQDGGVGSGQGVWGEEGWEGEG